MLKQYRDHPYNTQCAVGQLYNNNDSQEKPTSSTYSLTLTIDNFQNVRWTISHALLFMQIKIRPKQIDQVHSGQVVMNYTTLNKQENLTKVT